MTADRAPTKKLTLSEVVPERVLTQQELNNMFVERIASLEQLTEKLAKQIEKLEFKLGIDPS